MTNQHPWTRRHLARCTICRLSHDAQMSAFSAMQHLMAYAERHGQTVRFRRYAPITEGQKKQDETKNTP